MNYVEIDGKSFDVFVTSITEEFNILDTANAGRTISDGAMLLDRIGTFYNHKVTFEKKQGHEKAYDELYDLLSAPSNTGINVSLAHNQTVLNYKAYVSKGNRTLKNIQNNSVNWDKMDITFTAMSAQRKV